MRLYFGSTVISRTTASRQQVFDLREDFHEEAVEKAPALPDGKTSKDSVSNLNPPL